MNTPNKLTVARMIMVPFFVLFMLTGWGGDGKPLYCPGYFCGSQCHRLCLTERSPENIIW